MRVRMGVERFELQDSRQPEHVLEGFREALDLSCVWLDAILQTKRMGILGVFDIQPVNLAVIVASAAVGLDCRLVEGLARVVLSIYQSKKVVTTSWKASYNVEGLL